MKDKMKRQMILVLAMSIILILSEILFNFVYGILFGSSIIILVTSLFIRQKQFARILALVGIILSGMAIFMTKSIWLFLLFLIIITILYNTDVGFEFAHLNEQSVHPFRETANNTYQDIKIVQPQSNQRTLLERTPFIAQENANKSEFQSHDINLVYFGGDNLVDFGNTFLPDQETVVVIRKLYGRVRIIVPIEVGLSLNVSAFYGQVIFEQEKYALTGENFTWKSPNYKSSPRQLRFVLSVLFGDVEVIVL